MLRLMLCPAINPSTAFRRFPASYCTGVQGQRAMSRDG
jgi:hypothetical protein